MSKMSKKDASDAKPGLVRHHYKYKFEDEFGEPCDEWLDSIEAKCNEMLGNYSKPEAKALHRAFAARKRRRLNHIFGVIVFFYPDYPHADHESRKRKKKVTMIRNKVLKIQHGATPSQASEETLPL
jgi:hypothetical protein